MLSSCGLNAYISAPLDKKMGKRCLMPQVPIRILSNLPKLLSLASPRIAADHELMSLGGSLRTSWKELLKAHKFDVVLLNASPGYLMLFCLLRYLTPHSRWKLVSLDQNLLAPHSLTECAASYVKRIMLKKVDLFILYLRDLTGYERYYGVSADRAVYVPFKANIWDLVGNQMSLSSDGEYVLVAGRSMRDLKTFTEAMRLLEYPGVLLHQGSQVMAKNGTTIPVDGMPANVKVVQHDGNRKSWVEYIRKARVVAIPTVPTITAAGVSVYLDAMALKKCVILSDNPASRGILTGEAIIVPPQEPVRLAEAIREVWENHELRERIASAGREYVQTLQGEDRLLNDIIELCAKLAGADPGANGRHI
jgi:glycosyltransferase involved in cell wall biosynthesis